MTDLYKRSDRAVIVRPESGIAAAVEIERLRDLPDIDHDIDDPPYTGAHRLRPEADADQTVGAQNCLYLFVAEIARVAARRLAFRLDTGMGDGKGAFKQFQGITDPGRRHMGKIDDHVEVLSLTQCDASLLCETIALAAFAGADKVVVEAMDRSEYPDSCFIKILNLALHLFRFGARVDVMDPLDSQHAAHDLLARLTILDQAREIVGRLDQPQFRPFRAS